MSVFSVGIVEEFEIWSFEALCVCRLVVQRTK